MGERRRTWCAQGIFQGVCLCPGSVHLWLLGEGSIREISSVIAGFLDQGLRAPPLNPLLWAVCTYVKVNTTLSEG